MVENGGISKSEANFITIHHFLLALEGKIGCPLWGNDFIRLAAQQKILQVYAAMP
jgi:hypothetical protein